MDDTHSRPLPATFQLPNGIDVLVRSIRPGDAHLLVAMFHRMSERTRRLRFRAYTGNLPQERIWRQAVALSDVDPMRHRALVAVHHDDSGEHIAGVARLARATSDAIEAEAAVVVCDDFQRMGLGSRLLTLLLPIARSMNIERVFGWVAAENHHMLRIIAKTDLPVHIESHSGETFVVLSLPP